MFRAEYRTNIILLKRAYTRMASYWACYYKYRYPEFKYYVGRKLFEVEPIDCDFTGLRIMLGENYLKNAFLPKRTSINYKGHL